jgi:hypothetical protein
VGNPKSFSLARLDKPSIHLARSCDAESFAGRARDFFGATVEVAICSLN